MTDPDPVRRTLLMAAAATTLGAPAPATAGPTAGATASVESLIASIASRAPVNLAPNSQWEIFSAVGFGTRWAADGSRLLESAALLGNSTMGPWTRLHLAGIPAGWKAGDLVKLDNYTAGPELGAFPMRIHAVEGDDLIVLCPRGRTPGGTGTGHVRNVNIGGPASVGTGDAADGWKKTLKLQAWREDNAANLDHGMIYALGLNKGEADHEALYVPVDVTRFRTRTLAFGLWIKQAARQGGGTSRLFFGFDGTGGDVVYSRPAEGTGRYEWLEIAATCPADATNLRFGIELNGGRAETYYVGNPVFTPGTFIGEGNYMKPQEWLIPVVKLEPTPWINADITFPLSSATKIGWGWDIDMHADSGGAIARTVRLADGCIEGINDSPVRTGIAGSRLIGWADGQRDPVKLGNFMSQQATGVKTHQPLRLPLKDGMGIVFSGTPGDRWYNISMDLDVFFLE